MYTYCILYRHSATGYIDPIGGCCRFFRFLVSACCRGGPFIITGLGRVLLLFIHYLLVYIVGCVVLLLIHYLLVYTVGCVYYYYSFIIC